MHYTRIYTDSAGESRFERVDVSLGDKGPVGFLSEAYRVKSLEFRKNLPDYDWDCAWSRRP